MADTGDDAREHYAPEQSLPNEASHPLEASTPPQAPSMPPLLPLPPLIAQQPSALERWRVPLTIALVVVFLVFGALDLSSVLFRRAPDTGATRPIIVHAQVEADATPAAHPDLGVAPDALTIACGTTGSIIIANKSARPLQWTVTADASDGDALGFGVDTPQTSLLAPGQSIKVSVMAHAQPGVYLLHISDDHSETADVTVQVSC